MHQQVDIAIHPDDINGSVPFVKQPFFIWLAGLGNDAPGNWIDSMILYLVGPGYTRNHGVATLAGLLNSEQLDCFKHIHNHYWWLNQHGQQIAQLVLEAASQTNEELAA